MAGRFSGRFKIQLSGVFGQLAVRMAWIHHSPLAGDAFVDQPHH